MGNYDRNTLLGLLERAGVRNIKATGNGFEAACPLHNTRDGRPFSISLGGLWKCFNSACPGHAGGNMHMFLIRVVGMSAAEASSLRLPEIVDLDLESRLPAWDARVPRPEALPAITAARLAELARCPTYMLDRGFPKDFLRAYEIGYDPDFVVKDDAGAEHHVRRVTFPVRDLDGRCAGIVRRAIDPGDPGPKYKTGGGAGEPKIPKGSMLYLLDRVPVDAPAVAVGEGPVDALKARLAATWIDPATAGDLGLDNAVATLGGGLTGAQAALLVARRPRRIVLGFDNDEAGVAAREASIAELLPLGATPLHILVYEAHDMGALDSDTVRSVGSIPYWRRHTPVR